MTLNMPCFRTDGTLWFEPDVPSAGCVDYHVSLWNHDFSRVQGISNRIAVALQEYHETVIDLLRAGF